MIAAPLPRVFTYEWCLGKDPEFGQRVIVPWGNRLRVAMVHSVVDETESAEEFELKPVQACLDDGELLRGKWQQLIEFAADYYHYPLGLIALECLPKALRVLNAKGVEPVMVAKAREYALAAMAKRAELTEIDNRFASKPVAPPEFYLNPEQVDAVEALVVSSTFSSFLLYGVTGSGKTEVYLHAIAEKVAAGHQVLVLLPEINLTPAAQKLYEERLKPFKVMVLHSNLAELARTKAWYLAATGVADVVIATRLGVLTPMPRLGFVVVDEEHDPSYKQQEGMKYNARDLAVVLAKQRDVPVVLGSATPSLETWQKAELGQYKRLNLSARAVEGANLPKVELINTANFKPKEGLSEPVMQALKSTFESGKQSIVFLNRRGYAPQMMCEACGWVAGCKHCSAHMVWHKREKALRCHHCGAGQYVPSHCPDCGNQDLTGFGRGTQRVEEVLAQLLPDAVVLRIDADSTRNKGQIEDLLEQAHSGRANVLVGTQMIAKGHDFANVDLVVALNVDASLFSHSYKAPERLFAQLMQVAGRAGRRSSGAGAGARMMVQTRYPDQALFTCLKAHDYPGFAAHELQGRLEARMPPFSYQAMIRADHKNLGNCLEFLKMAKAVGEDLAREEGVVFICDPVPLTVVRVAEVERAQMLVESESRPALHRFLNAWLLTLWEVKTSTRWFVEVDPAEL